MAGTGDIEGLKKEIKLRLERNELDKAMKELYQDAYEAAGDNAEKLYRIQEEIGKEIRRQKSDVDYVAQSFADSVNELSKGNSALREQKQNLSKLTKTARDLLDIRGGEVTINEKVLKKKQEEIRLGERNLKSVKRQLEAQGENTEAIDNQIKDLQHLKDGYVAIEKTVKKTNKDLGAIPALAAGIDKALQKAGLPALGLQEALEATHMAAQEAAQAGEGFDAMGVFTGNVKDNLMEALTPANLIQFALVEVVGAMIDIDKQSGEMAKNFGISYDQARGLSSELNDAANDSYLLSITTEGLTESFTKLNNEFGTFAKISEDSLVAFGRLTGEAKLSDEAALGLYKTTFLTGKTLEDSTAEVLGQVAAMNAQTGLALNQKQILEAISKVSAATTLSLGGSTEELTKAVYQAKALGIEMSKLESIADGLIQFESSITNELEAELLIGRDLNLERARLLALNNDIAGAAEEIASQVGTAAEFTKMNRIQQEALAKAVGMTREDLASSLMEREALANLAGIEGDTAKERFNNLVKEVGLEEAKKRIGNDNLANMYASESIQERFTQSVEKLKEIFVSVGEVLLPIFDVMASILGVVAPIASFVGTIVKKFEGLIKVLTIVYGLNAGINALNSAQIGLMGAREASHARILNFLLLEDARLAYQMAMEEGLGVMAAIRAGMEQTILGSMILQTGAMVKNIAKGVIELGIRSAIAAAELAGAAASTLGVGVPVILGATALGVAGLLALISKSKKADDLLSPGQGSSGYGNRMLLAPEGAFALNNNDTIIAGTNLNPPPQASQAVANAEQRRTNMLLERLVAKDSNVYMDSDKVGSAFAKSATF